MEPEVIDVTCSKLTIYLDPSKHLAIIFRQNQNVATGGEFLGPSRALLTKGNSKLGKKGIGGNLKVARNLKILNKSNPSKGVKFMFGHNTLVPLHGSMKKMVKNLLLKPLKFWVQKNLVQRLNNR